MRNSFLMGLDIGGGSGRCILVDVETGAIFTASRSWTHPVAPGTAGFGFDLDLENIWHNLGVIAKEAVAKAGASRGDILGIAATSMRHGSVVLDKDGTPLMTFTNKDARAAMEAFTLDAEHGQEFYDRSGHWPCPIFAAAHLTWMANSAPDALKKAACVMSISDWTGFRLTGVTAAEPSQAGETMLLDLESRDWADDLIKELKFSRQIFPKVMNAGETLGALTKDAADHLGLIEGIPVAVGGGDTQSGLLGSGAVSPGQITVVAGTTTPIQMIVDRPVVDSGARLWTGQHLIPGMWVLESNAGKTGSILDMFANILYPGSNFPVASLMAEATLASPGSNGMISTLGAELFNAKGLMNIPVGNLTFSPIIAEKENGRANLCRSILEGLAYALVANIEQLKDVGGDMADLKLCGGLSRSPLWAQINSDILNVPVNVFNPQATALGAAICAGVGAGVFKDLAKGAEKLAKHLREHTPDKVTSGMYQRYYADWKELLEARKEIDGLAGGKIMGAIIGQEEEAVTVRTDFRPRVLVTAEMDEASLNDLRQMADVEYASYRDTMHLLTADDLTKALEGVNIFVTEVDIVDAKSLTRLPDLKLVIICRANPVNVDIAACTKLGIPVLNAPGRNADAVADIAVGFMLMLARRFPEVGNFLREPGGEAGDMGRMGMAHGKFQGKEMWGKTVGLVGMGAVGRKTAKRVLAFGASVLAYDPYITPEQAIMAGGEKVSLDRLLSESDFISLHAPVTKETREMINKDAFDKMKDGAFLINTARAALIDEDALFDALDAGTLGGAALDVFSEEPPGADDPLFDFENVIGTPHIGGNTLEIGAHQGQIVADELKLLLNGKKPRYILNPELLDGFNWTAPHKELSSVEIEALESSAGLGVSDLELEAKEKSDDQKKKERKRRKSKDADGRAGGASRAEIGVMRGNMTRLLEIFADKISNDKILQGFSEDKDVSMVFNIPDLDLEFFLCLNNGKVASEMGGMDDPDVVLKMKATILDCIFTGRIKGMSAAMDGDLSFSGDTSKAMTFQSIQNDLIRLYGEAREEAGDPGDLASIGAASEKPPAQKEAAAQAVVSGAPAIIRVGDIRDDLLDAMNELYSKELITATGGNVSVRIPGKDNEIWISPSQINKGSLRADMMVRIDLEGNPLDPDGLSASTERKMHARIFRKRPEVNAVIHAHAPNATILEMTGTPFLPISTEAAFIGNIPNVPFVMPGSKEVADAVEEAIGNKGIAVFLKNHGQIVAATSLQRAVDMTDVIEVTAKTLLACRSLGVDPPILPDDLVKELQEIGVMMS